MEILETILTVKLETPWLTVDASNAVMSWHFGTATTKEAADIVVRLSALPVVFNVVTDVPVQC